ncbi:MAG: hypothetical protein H5U01_14940, partial [Clostridia bacterium]|nr:hypothetical protein [Clostridia bacterium]
MLEELRRRNALWNRLVEIEHDYRTQVAALLRTRHDAELERLEAELHSVRKEIGRRRNAARSARVDCADLVERARTLRRELGETRRLAREARRAVREANQEKLAHLENERREKVYQARLESGLYWGNHEEVAATYDMARRQARRAGGELRFRPWDGTGKVTVRFQQGLPARAVFSG